MSSMPAQRLPASARVTRRAPVARAPAAALRAAPRGRFAAARRALATRVRRVMPSPFIVDDMFDAISRSFHRPLFIATLLLSTAFLVSFKNLDEGPISRLLPKDSKNPIVIWCRANIAKFFAGVLFAPVIADVQANRRLQVLAATLLWIYVAPQAAFVEYAIQAVLLHLFLHMRTAHHRTIIFAVAFVAYFAGFLFVPHKSSQLPFLDAFDPVKAPLTNSSPPSTPKPQ